MPPGPSPSARPSRGPISASLIAIREITSFFSEGEQVPDFLPFLPLLQSLPKSSTELRPFNAILQVADLGNDDTDFIKLGNGIEVSQVSSVLGPIRYKVFFFDDLSNNPFFVIKIFSPDVNVSNTVQTQTIGIILGPHGSTEVLLYQEGCQDYSAINDAVIKDVLTSFFKVLWNVQSRYIQFDKQNVRKGS